MNNLIHNIPYFKPEEYKSKIILGNLVLLTNKKINLFHKIMFKLLLGIKIERINNGKKTI